MKIKHGPALIDCTFWCVCVGRADKYQSSNHPNPVPALVGSYAGEGDGGGRARAQGPVVLGWQTGSSLSPPVILGRWQTLRFLRCDMGRVLNPQYRGMVRTHKSMWVKRSQSVWCRPPAPSYHRLSPPWSQLAGRCSLWQPAQGRER